MHEPVRDVLADALQPSIAKTRSGYSRPASTNHFTARRRNSGGFAAGI